MKWYYNLKVGTKILLVFIIIALFNLFIGLLAIHGLYKVMEADQSLYVHNTLPLGQMANISICFHRVRVNMRDAILEKNIEEKKAYLNRTDELLVEMNKSMDSFSKSIKNDQTKKLFYDVQTALNTYMPILEQVNNLSNKGKEEEAFNLIKKSQYLAKSVTNSIDYLFAAQLADAKQKSEQNKKVFQATKSIVLISACTVIFIALLLGIFISRLISQPIKKIKEVADKLAIGDIDVKIDLDSKDEIGSLAKSFVSMIENTKNQVELVEKIAAGNTKIKIEAKSEKDVMNKSLQLVVNNLNKLIQEATMLNEAAFKGQLSTRGNVNDFAGGYREIVLGVNKTLDAVIEPVQEAAMVLQEMKKGNLHINMQGNYYGDHAIIKEAMNDFINTICSYVDEIAQLLIKMSQGNMSVSIDREYLGDFQTVKQSLNMIAHSFNQVLGDINLASAQVASASRQVSDSSQALSQGATEQASSIEEITSSMVEIAEQTKQNALNANKASNLALAVRENASTGNEQMADMLNAMGQINQSSSDISKIIKVIDEIAFQTNILSLNAAVEAARAGQHGKGFAVVAEEVRNLAARSANAAKETTVLIEDAIIKVETGTKIANQTAEALNNIVTGVAQAADLVGGIAIASNEQATAIAQVNQAIAQADKVVQINTATAEESASASQELFSQAELLNNMVSKFKLTKDNLSVQKQKITKNFSLSQTDKEEIAKIKIALDDNEFGKY